MSTQMSIEDIAKLAMGAGQSQPEQPKAKKEAVAYINIDGLSVEVDGNEYTLPLIGASNLIWRVLEDYASNSNEQAVAVINQLMNDASKDGVVNIKLNGNFRRADAKGKQAPVGDITKLKLSSERE